MAAIKISQFIDCALFDRLAGYYQTKNPIGKNSDFITSPEISQTFGEIIAAYILQTFLPQNSFSFVEMGAGKGTLYFDILSVITKLAANKNQLALDFLRHATFHIVEINPILKKIQQEKLRDFDILWHDKFDDFAGEILFISNELFDCFPIDQFVKTDLGWCERLIDENKFVTANFDPAIDRFVRNLITDNSPFGAVFEYSQKAREFMAQLCQAIKTQGGMAINFDYGYFKTDFANSLQAIKNHRKTDIFESNCDITAHVDFAALDQIAKNHNLASSLITQREFLVALGIEERKKKLPTNQHSAIDRLIDPSQMGELFKCHIIWKKP